MSFLETEKKVAWSTIVQVAGKFVQLVLSVATVKLVTAYLGPEEYGIYGKIAEFAIFFSTVANLGIFGNIVRKMSESPKDGKLLWNGILLRIFTAGIFFVIAIVYAFLFIKDAYFLYGLLFFSASLFLDYITLVCDGALQANYLMGRAVMAQIVGKAVALIATIFIIDVVNIQEAYLFFLVPLSGSILTLFFSYLFVKQRIKLVFKLDKELLTFLFLTSLPFGIINILNNLYFRFLPSLFASKNLSNGDFASYNISLHIATLVSLFSTFLMFSTLPALKESIKHGHKNETKKIFKLMFKIMGLSAVLVVTFGSFLSPIAIEMVSGKDFFRPELWFILPLLLVLAGVSYFYDLMLITIFALEDDIWFLKREIFALVLSLAIFFSSYLFLDLNTKIFLIIVAAICGESIMVLLSLSRIKKHFNSPDLVTEVENEA